MSTKLDRKISWEIIRKTEYAEKTFASIPNGNQAVCEEVVYQIGVCEELGVPLALVTIKSLLYCKSPIQVEQRARVQKLQA